MKRNAPRIWRLPTCQSLLSLRLDFLTDPEIEEYFTRGGGLIQRVEMDSFYPLIQQICTLLSGIVDAYPADA